MINGNLKLVGCFCISLLLSACQENNSSEPLVFEEGCGGYPVFEGGHNVRVEEIIENEQGTMCYVVRTFDQAEDRFTILPSHWRYRVECVDQTQQLQHCFIPTQDKLIKDIAFNQSGDLLIAELSPLPVLDSDTFTHYQLNILRRSLATNATLQTAPLYDTPTENELLYFDTNFETGEITSEVMDFAVRDGSIPVLGELSDVQLIWQGDQLHMLAGTYGIKYYQFDSDLTLLRDIPIAPAHSTLWFHSLAIRRIAHLAISEHGDAVVSMDLSRERARFLNAAYDTQFAVSDLGVQQLVTFIDQKSLAINQVVVGNDQVVEFIAGVQIRNGIAWLANNTLLKKDNAAGGTTEWDVALMAVDVSTKLLKHHFVLHDDQEDIVNDFNLLPDDLMLLSGSNGYAQADTRSQVSNGRGFHWVVNQAGEIINKERVNGERDTQVLRTSVSGHHIVHAKLYDGPITHTCDYDPERTLCYNKAMIEVSDLSQ